MNLLRTGRLAELWDSTTLFLGLLWLGLALLVVGFVVLMYTRWGQYHPLSKSLGLSLLAHALLAGFSTTLYVAPTIPLLRDEVTTVRLPDGPVGPPQEGSGLPISGGGTGGGGMGLAQRFRSKPWDGFGLESDPRPIATDLARAEPPDTRTPERRSQTESIGLAGAVFVPQLPLAPSTQPQPGALATLPTQPVLRSAGQRWGGLVEPIEVPAAQRREAVRAGQPGVVQLGPQPQPTRPAAEPVRKVRAGLPKELMERTVPVLRPHDLPVAVDSQMTLPATAGQSPGAVALRPSGPVSHGAVGVEGQGSGMVGTGPDAQGAAGQPGPGQIPLVGTPFGSGGGPGGSPSSGGGMGHLKPPAIAGSGTGAGVGGSGGGLAGPDIGPPATSLGPPMLPGRSFGRPDQRLPGPYQLRTAPDRALHAERQGATAETEAAVRAALKWFASVQSADGRWDPRKFEAGREGKIAGRDRAGAGTTADTGLTGLATLAFLADGSTHLSGPHQATTRRALEYLLANQAQDGNLGGPSASYEFMYCHAMATIALSEAYGMTKDPSLREPVRRAAAYIISAQDPIGGGWRYKSQQAGDTSQLGWQLMALRSAELAGIAVPLETWKGVERFLKDVSSGAYGGLAAYRPREQVSRTMTAEALMCRQFLGLPPDSTVSIEAGNYLLGELPGEGRPDYYYWYYGTIAMHELGGDFWARWNNAMRTTLPALQLKTGAMAGSWDPDPIWGSYGGRIYSTALATLCLEVYYRYLPLTGAAASGRQPK